jgi:hypothetical protein
VKKLSIVFHPADTPKQYWKVSLYHALIDHMIMGLESCLIKSENRFYAEYLLLRVLPALST